MLQDFQSIAWQPFELGNVVGNLLVAFLCGFAISALYRWTYQGSNYSPTFVRSMIFLAMITAVVMMVIGNSLARAFGLVGAMSIIRFRTAVKDVQDIVFIFFALAVGLAAGVGMHLIAISGTVLIGLTIAITSKSDYAAPNRQSFLLQLTYTAQGNGHPAYLPVLERHCKRHKLVNVRAAGGGDLLDLTFYVNLRDKEQSAVLTRELGQVAHVSNVNLFYDEEPL